jgi:hypothetical protein
LFLGDLHIVDSWKNAKSNSEKGNEMRDEYISERGKEKDNINSSQSTTRSNEVVQSIGK